MVNKCKKVDHLHKVNLNQVDQNLMVYKNILKDKNLKVDNKILNNLYKLYNKCYNKVLNLLEACRILSILLQPFMPDTARSMSQQLGTDLGTLKDCKFGAFTGKPKRGEMLFKKVLTK